MIHIHRRDQHGLLRIFALTLTSVEADASRPIIGSCRLSSPGGPGRDALFAGPCLNYFYLLSVAPLISVNFVRLYRTAMERSKKLGVSWILQPTSQDMLHTTVLRNFIFS